MTLDYIYLAAIGLSWIITNSYIFETPRKVIEETADAYPDSKFWDMIDYMFNCIICMSMWTFIPFYTVGIYAFGFSKSSFLIYWFCTPVFVILFNAIISFMNKEEDN